VTSSLPVLLGAIFIVVAFVGLIFVFRAPAHLKRALAVSQEAAAVLRNPEATDDDKEKAAQRSSVQLFGQFFLIMASFAGALLAPVGVIWLLDLAHILSLQAVLAQTMSVTFLVACTVIGCAIAFALPRLRARRAGADK
jgi:hypothetical protein